MTNCLEGFFFLIFFAFLKIPFIPKGKRVVSEGKIYIYVFIYTEAHAHTNTRTHIQILFFFFFFLPKMQVLRNSFSLRCRAGCTRLMCFCHGGFELGEGVVGCCRSPCRRCQEMPTTLRAQISSCFTRNAD